MLFRVYPVFLCNQRCCSTTQWPHSDIVLSNFAGETIILQAPKQEPHYQLSRSRPKGKKNVRNRPGRLPATAGTFRRSAPGSHSACATSRRPCSRSRPSCPGGSVNKQTRLWKVWSRLQPLPHSLGHKTRVHWSPGWFSESDRTGGCCQMCVTCHPRPQCSVVSPHLGSNPALPTPCRALGRLPKRPGSRSPALKWGEWQSHLTGLFTGLQEVIHKKVFIRGPGSVRHYLLQQRGLFDPAHIHWALLQGHCSTVHTDWLK